VKRYLLPVLALVLSGCSATSLRCGVDNDSSFVELYNVPQNFSQNIRSYSELCGFAYESPTAPQATLNIIEPE
jgi:outer membrane biogenesis lipoprotein LolB